VIVKQKRKYFWDKYIKERRGPKEVVRREGKKIEVEVHGDHGIHGAPCTGEGHHN